MATSKFHYVGFSSYVRYCLISMVVMFCSGVALQAQDEAAKEKDTRPIKNTFESIWLGDNQTVMLPIKGTFEMDFQHRFGTWDNGYDDFFGVFAPSNMRIGFNISPYDRLMLGLGFTKQDLLWDFYGKYAIFRQGRVGGSPVSLTYYVNAVTDTRQKEKTKFSEELDRWSFFHQLMIARKLTDKLSLQVSGNYTWFNFKDPVFDEEGAPVGRDKNGHFTAGALARYRLTNSMGVIAAFDQPITDHKYIDPFPHVCIGIELTSSSHAFQIFVSNYKSLSPSYNDTFSPYDFGDNQILFGFNLTRLWNF